MSKYKVGYKAIVEIDKVFEQDGEKLYRAKGMKSLVFDGKGLDKLEPIDKYKIINLNAGRLAGQNEAWELARKIVLMEKEGGMKDEDYKAIFGSCQPSDYILKTHTYQEATEKVEAWEKAKKKIKVGDVVEVDGRKCIVTGMLTIDEDFKQYSVVTEYGSAFPVSPDLMTKTGRHIDIDSFLKQIGEE